MTAKWLSLSDNKSFGAHRHRFCKPSRCQGPIKQTIDLLFDEMASLRKVNPSCRIPGLRSKLAKRATFFQRAYSGVNYSSINCDTHYNICFVRHGQSTWNRDNRFIGWTDTPLTGDGVLEARMAGQMLRASGILFDEVHTVGDIFLIEIDDSSISYR